MATSYNSAQVLRIIRGLTQRCLDYWDEKEIVKPSIQKAHGSGSERKYSFEDLNKLHVVKHLRDEGLSLQGIQKAVQVLRKRRSKGDPLSHEVLVTDGKGVFQRRPNNELADILANGQLLLNIIRVDLIREETQATIVKLEKKEIADKAARARRRVGS